ncbi:pyridoxal 4-dehydrogenase [Sphingomonas sp. Leaf339]|uniref:aldo/keto reductase n=1 Tax=Sphingomonas sp. Leaf339 TaxID=1736343 RepID=UPI0006F81FBC|nr:aldo/keto reductase [Sphingomonas sp. Leaf339]KQU49778.1 pyridoxal 4-dehydrogenase [Sphingomonas sp. Leaf339]
MTAIPRRSLGATDLLVTELGFGAATLGNLFTPVSDAVARAALDRAIEAGIGYIDTAPHYGRGLSERRTGDAVRLRTELIVSTKVGRLMQPDSTVIDDRERDGFRSPMPFQMTYDYTGDGILRSHDHSLQRLGLDHVDILYVHDIGQRTHASRASYYWDQLTTGGGFRALERLRDEGAIKAFGLGVNEIDVCLDAMHETRLDVILLAGRYTLLEHDALDELFPASASDNTSIVIGGPYNSGILAMGTKGGGVVHYDYGIAPEHVVARVRQIEDVADRHGVSLPAAALQFVLANRQVASVIPGLGSADRVQQTMTLYREQIPDDFWNELREQNLIRRDAPVPTAAR